MEQSALIGYRKIIALMAGMVATVVLSKTGNPELAKSAESIIIDLSPLLASVAYLIINTLKSLAERKGEIKKLESETGMVANGSKPLAPPPSAAPTAPAPTVAPPAQPLLKFEAKEIDQFVEERAKAAYLEANDVTRYFAATDVISRITADNWTQILDAWDYLLGKAFKAYEAKFGFPYEKRYEHLKDNPLCPYYSPESMARQLGIDYWNMLLDVERVIRQHGETERLAKEGYDWRAKNPNISILGIPELPTMR